MSWIGAVAGLLVAAALLPPGPRARCFGGLAIAGVAAVLLGGAIAGPELARRFDSITNPTAATTATAAGDKARLQLWSGARSTGEAHPVSGVGLGELPQELAQRGAPGGPGTHAHSTYLQTFAEAGLLGLFALGVIGVGIASDLRVCLRRGSWSVAAGAGGALAVVLVVWTTDFTLRFGAVAGFIAAIVGTIAGQAGILGGHAPASSRRSAQTATPA